MEWLPTKVSPALKARELHVWRIYLPNLGPKSRELRTLLSEEEKARGDRYIRSADGAKFANSRAALRLILAGYLDVKANRVVINVGRFGKPYVPKSMNNNDLMFNLSHSGELCLVAVGYGREIGVDVEKIREDVAVEDLATRYFAPEEIAELHALPHALRRLGFFLCWTRKEAYVKAKAAGLQIPLDQFSVPLTPGRPAELRGTETGGWTIRSLDPGEGYVAALVTETGVDSVRYCDYMG
jgi:4'-phosphopantetheinyl transferase